MHAVCYVLSTPPPPTAALPNIPGTSSKRENLSSTSCGDNTQYLATASFFPLLLAQPTPLVVPACVEGSLHTNNSVTPAGRPTIDLNSDSVFLEIVTDPTGWGLSPAALSPPHRGPSTHLRCSHEPGFSPGFSPDLLITGSNGPLLGSSSFARAAQRTLGNSLIFTRSWKEMLKGAEEQPDEEMHRARSGRGELRGFCALGAGLSPSCCGCVCPPGISSDPHSWSLRSFVTQARLVISSPFSPFPLREWGPEGL